MLFPARNQKKIIKRNKDMANQWFRLYSEFATDPKVQMMSESNQRRLMMLFCIRCSNNNVTLHDEEVTFQLRITETEWADTKALFISKNFIDKNNKILNWDKRQFISDSSAARVAKHRAKKKNECNVTVTPPEQNRTEQRQSKKKSIKRKKTTKQILNDFGIEGQLANDFITHRKTLKKAITETAMQGFLREAKIANIPISEAVTISIQRGWQGFNAEWDYGQERGKSNATKTEHQIRQDARSEAIRSNDFLR